MVIFLRLIVSSKRMTVSLTIERRVKVKTLLTAACYSNR